MSEIEGNAEDYEYGAVSLVKSSSLLETFVFSCCFEAYGFVQSVVIRKSPSTVPVHTTITHAHNNIPNFTRHCHYH